MKTSEFVNELKKIPKKERVRLLIELELPEEFINEYLNSYSFKENSMRNKLVNDSIIDLTSNYNGSEVKIGMITFDIEPFENNNFYFFGRFELDLLAINKKNKLIQLIDYENENHIIFNCAENSDLFLSSILVMAKFLEKLPYDDELLGNQPKLCEMANICSKIAGDNIKYSDFFKTVVGCDL